MTARHEGRTARDTTADDCAEGFLGELDEILWVLQDVQQAADVHFRQASRKDDHIQELRRQLYRLHLVLTGWEECAATETGGPAGTG
jgi:predicted Zn-dependent protease